MRLSRHLSSWSLPADEAAPTSPLVTGELVALSTARTAPRHCRSVPCHDWPPRGGPSYAGRPACCQAHRSRTGQTSHRGERARQTSAPISMTATLQVLAVSADSGRSVSARSLSARVSEIAAWAAPLTILARTRRTLVSTTVVRLPKAKADTAAVV